MRMESEVWVKITNKGNTNDTRFFNGPLRNAIQWIAKALLDISMRYRIEIAIAKTKEELESKDRKQSELTDIMSELDSILSEEGTE